jgi:pimeloyl-ACP methyl ester carboxylesterase
MRASLPDRVETVHASFDIGDRTLAYRRTGAGPPIIVLNEFAATKDDWDPSFTAALARERELVLVDNRGMGEPGGDGEPFTVADMAAAVAGLIKERLRDLSGTPRTQARRLISLLFPHA